MAQKQTIEYIDDLYGGPADETIKFALDGINYTIDLSTPNAVELRDALKVYTDAARRDNPATATKPAKGKKRTDLDKIRIWAGRNGYDIAARGRIPFAVVEAYDNAA